MHKSPSTLLRVISFAVLALAALGVVYLTAPTKVGPDLARTKPTENRKFIATLAPQGGEPTVGPLSTWTIEIRYPDGSPVREARLGVDGGMPDHDHGLPTRPEVSGDLGDGRYRVDGIKFSMPGRWVLRFEITTAEGTDRAAFNILL
jgi:hypothetical protein